VKVRSPRLLALALALLASAAGLAYLLYHDAEVGGRLGHADLGEDVALKGDFEPREVPGSPKWAEARNHLLENSYQYVGADAPAEWVILATSHAQQPGTHAIARGEIVYVAPHPDQPEKLLVIVQVAEWVDPILFR
jgi:hypothetical protein